MISIWLMLSLSDLLKISFKGKICIDQRCPVAYDEKSADIPGNQEPTIMAIGSLGSIYGALWTLSKIKPSVLPRPGGSFFHFRSMNVDTSSGVVYGEVGFIIGTFEEIFGNMSVSPKKRFQTGKSMVRWYVYKYAGEAVVRANILDLLRSQQCISNSPLQR